jgi:lysine biosynthesis protein LysW
VETHGGQEEGWQEVFRNQDNEEEVARSNACEVAPGRTGPNGKKVSMPKATCPVCDHTLRLSDDEAMLYEQVTCPHCHALLEVVDEDPTTLEEVADI